MYLPKGKIAELFVTAISNCTSVLIFWGISTGGVMCSNKGNASGAAKGHGGVTWQNERLLPAKKYVAWQRSTEE